MSDKELKEEIPVGAKHVIEIDLEDGTVAKAYFKPIPRHVFESALGHLTPTTGQPRIVTAGELIYKSCVLKADPRIEQDEELATDFFLKAVELIERRSGSIKKL